MRALAAPQVAVRLDDRFGLLTAGERTDLPCQQTLRATMDWSFPAHLVRALVPAAIRHAPDCGSRMTGDRHVRF
jgi:predicted ATPase